MKQETESLPIVLAKRILEEIRESGANHTEALCALQVALALIPDLGLQPKPTLTIQA
jgi:hypothetical protein